MRCSAKAASQSAMRLRCWDTPPGPCFASPTFHMCTSHHASTCDSVAVTLPVLCLAIRYVHHKMNNAITINPTNPHDLTVHTETPVTPAIRTVLTTSQKQRLPLKLWHRNPVQADSVLPPSTSPLQLMSNRDCSHAQWYPHAKDESSWYSQS